MAAPFANGVSPVRSQPGTPGAAASQTMKSPSAEADLANLFKVLDFGSGVRTGRFCYLATSALQPVHLTASALSARCYISQCAVASRRSIHVLFFFWGGGFFSVSVLGRGVLYCVCFGEGGSLVCLFWGGGFFSVSVLGRGVL